MSTSVANSTPISAADALAMSHSRRPVRRYWAPAHAAWPNATKPTHASGRCT